MDPGEDLSVVNCCCCCYSSTVLPAWGMLLSMVFGNEWRMNLSRGVHLGQSLFALLQHASRRTREPSSSGCPRIFLALNELRLRFLSPSFYYGEVYKNDRILLPLLENHHHEPCRSIYKAWIEAAKIHLRSRSEGDDGSLQR